MASEMLDGDKGDAAKEQGGATKPDRPDPPVGTDGPAADRKETVPLDDLNSADDE